MPSCLGGARCCNTWHPNTPLGLSQSLSWLSRPRLSCSSTCHSAQLAAPQQPHLRLNQHTATQRCLGQAIDLPRWRGWDHIATASRCVVQPGENCGGCTSAPLTQHPRSACRHRASPTVHRPARYDEANSSAWFLTDGLMLAPALALMVVRAVVVIVLASVAVTGGSNASACKR